MVEANTVFYPHERDPAITFLPLIHCPFRNLSSVAISPLPSTVLDVL